MVLECSNENRYRRNAIYGHYKPHFWFIHGKWHLSGLYGTSERAMHTYSKLPHDAYRSIILFHKKLKGI